MSKIIDIQIERIHPHPNNPRKALGDLTELAESIRVNGIMQNLTVIPHPDMKDDYIAIIGHRRREAAELAGLEAVPCMVVELTEKHQLGMMLLENMQRSDLTAYEQAQGFQMMLDLGETVHDISAKTGLSKNTVYRRIKLLDLDSEKFKESEERGASIADYLELEKITSIELKNKVLEHVGTANFQNELRRAIEKETQDARWEKMLALIKSFATETKDTSGLWHVRYVHRSSHFEMPEDVQEKKYYYTTEEYGLYLYAERVCNQENTAEQDARHKEREETERREAELDAIAIRVFKLRLDFVKKLKPSKIKSHLAEIVTAETLEAVSHWVRLEENNLLLILDANIPTEGGGLTEILPPIAKQSVERLIIARAYLDFEDSKGNSYHTWNGKHKDNESLDALYGLLGILGYQMSDEEKAYQDGSHELFLKEEEN